MMLVGRVRRFRDAVLLATFGISIGYLLGIFLAADSEIDAVEHIHIADHDSRGSRVGSSAPFQLRCVVMVHPNAAKIEKIVSAIDDGYSKLCNETVYYSNVESIVKKIEKKRNTVYVDISYNNYFWSFYQYIMEHSAKVPSRWTFLADDQTYLIVPHLQRILADFDADEPIILGKVKRSSSILSWMFPFVSTQKVSIRSGIVLTNSAIDRLARCKGMWWPRASESSIYECSQEHGVRIVDPFDEDSLRLFNDLPPRYIISPDDKKPEKISKCSDHAITFGQLSMKDMRLIEFGMTMKVFGKGEVVQDGSRKEM